MPVSEMVSPGARAFWDRSVAGRLALFEALRARPAIEFHAESAGPGFWSVVGYHDVVTVSHNPEVFSSAQGFTIDDVPAEIREFAMSMIAMDNPRHRYLRSIVQSAFTAASVRSITDRIRGHAHRIATDLRAGRCSTSSTGLPADCRCRWSVSCSASPPSRIGRGSSNSRVT